MDKNSSCLGMDVRDFVVKKHVDLLALSIINHNFEENWFEHLMRQRCGKWFEIFGLEVSSQSMSAKEIGSWWLWCDRVWLLSFVATWSSLRDLSLARLEHAVTDKVVRKLLDKFFIGLILKDRPATSILSVEMSTFQELQYLIFRIYLWLADVKHNERFWTCFRLAREFHFPTELARTHEQSASFV